MQGHLETSLRDNPHVEGRRRPPPPMSCPGTVAWEDVPGGGQGQGGGQAQPAGNSEQRAWEAVGS